jgi:hypothetical protein
VTSVLLALWLAHPIDVQGDITCPTAGEVSEHLANLVSSDTVESPEPAPHAYLSAGAGFINVELLRADGGLLAERRLDRTAPCAELAEAVAVVLAAWQAKYYPVLAPAAIDLPGAPTVVTSSEKVESRRPIAFDLGVGLLTSVAAGEAVFGAKLEGVMLPFAVPMGLHLGLSVPSTHSQSITAPSLEARWLRPAMSLGPGLRLRARTLALDIHASAAFALLNVKGVGLREGASDTGTQFGLAAGVRILWYWSSGAVWIGAELFDYPGQDRLTVENIGEVGRLPHLEAQFAVGISLGRFR